MVLANAAAMAAVSNTNGDPFLLSKSTVGRSPDDNTEGTQMDTVVFLGKENHYHKENDNDLLIDANRLLSSSEPGAVGNLAKTEKVNPTKATQIGKKAERTRRTVKAAKASKAKAGKAGKKSSKCNPDTDVVLSDYQQWEDETGYWIGEYSFYQGDGTPYVSSSWPYPYDSYMGFITGNVSGYVSVVQEQVCWNIYSWLFSVLTFFLVL
jgi:hypothetical protein